MTEGAFLQTGGTTFFDGGTIDNTTGNVSFAFDSLIGQIPGVSGSGVLAHIDLVAMAFGNTALGLTDVLALDSLINEITVVAQPITLAVPEPATVSLIFLVAGAGLMVRRRRRVGVPATAGGALSAG